MPNYHWMIRSTCWRDFELNKNSKKRYNILQNVIKSIFLIFALTKSTHLNSLKKAKNPFAIIKTFVYTLIATAHTNLWIIGFFWPTDNTSLWDPFSQFFLARNRIEAFFLCVLAHGFFTQLLGQCWLALC